LEQQWLPARGTKMTDRLAEQGISSHVQPLHHADLRELMVSFAMGQLLGGEMEFLEVRDLVFKCRCSRERVEQTLQALGPDEVLSLIEDPGFAEVTCHFCNAIYRLEPSELRGLFPAP